MATKFELDVKRWAEQAGVKAETFAREFTQDMAREVVGATPVDTGYLRNSWDSYLNDPASRQRDGFDPTGQQTIARMTVTLNGMRLGDVAYILNSANYAEHVEFGTSRMEPRAFVRGTLSKAQLIAQQTAARVLRIRGGR